MKKGKVGGMEKFDHPFDSSALVTIFEAARVAFSDENIRAAIGDELDISDEYIFELVKKLNVYMGGDIIDGHLD